MLQSERKKYRIAIQRVRDYQTKLVKNLPNMPDRELGEELILAMDRVLIKLRKELSSGQSN